MPSTSLSRRSWFIHQNNSSSKPELRAHFREIRRQISSSFREQAAIAAANIIIQQDIFKRSQHIACYVSYQDEFATELLMEAIWQAGKRCYLPVLTPQKTLRFIRYQKRDALQKNRYSILEPADDTHEIVAAELDLVITPLLAFDLSGHRLGTGGGYYDRTFAFLQENPARKPFMLGVGFSVQQAELLPQESWDIEMDGVLTEKGFEYF